MVQSLFADQQSSISWRPIDGAVRYDLFMIADSDDSGQLIYSGTGIPVPATGQGTLCWSDIENAEKTWAEIETYFITWDQFRFLVPGGLTWARFEEYDYTWAEVELLGDEQSGYCWREIDSIVAGGWSWMRLEAPMMSWDELESHMVSWDQFECLPADSDDHQGYVLDVPNDCHTLRFVMRAYDTQQALIAEAQTAVLPVVFSDNTVVGAKAFEQYVSQITANGVPAFENGCFTLCFQSTDFSLFDAATQVYNSDAKISFADEDSLEFQSDFENGSAFTKNKAVAAFDLQANRDTNSQLQLEWIFI